MHHRWISGRVLNYRAEDLPREEEAQAARDRGAVRRCNLRLETRGGHRRVVLDSHLVLPIRAGAGRSLSAVSPRVRASPTGWELCSSPSPEYAARACPPLSICT